MPVIEEVEDDEIDNKHYSIDDFDSYNPFSKDTPVDPDAPVQLRPTATANTSSKPEASRAPSSVNSSSRPSFNAPTREPESNMRKINPSAQIPEHMKQWAVIYPIYFDKTRSVKEGRRVSQSLGVDNPIAVLISDACQSLGFESALEINKTHPNDWSNPGRVRVKLPTTTKKTDIYSDISMFLKLHPVTRESAREQMYAQIAEFDSLEPLAVPRNMKLHKILPGVSPAVSARKSIDQMMSMEGGDMAKMMGMR